MSAAAPRRTVQNAHAKLWTPHGRAEPTRVVTFRIALATSKSDAQLDRIVQSLSDITSLHYGKYLRTNEQLGEHFRPHASSTQAMQQFVKQFGDKHLETQVSAVGDYWSVSVDVATAEKMFDTEFYEFAHHNVNELKVLRPRDAYSIPASIASHVVYIDGLESFPTEKQAKYMVANTHRTIGNTVRGDGQDGDPFAIKQHSTPPKVDLDRVFAPSEVITPAMIRQQYDIPDDITRHNGTHPKNKFVIGSFLHEFYTETDLQQFLTQYDPSAASRGLQLPVTKGDCIASASSSSAKTPTGEASLDIQVAASISRSDNIEMLCYTSLRDDTRPLAADNQEPFLTFLQDVNAMDPPPSVVSISYTDDECSVPQAYALAVNRELMKSAMKGITVLISAGDAGSQGSHLADFCNIPSCTQFLANFPASSPYVTAVGATTLDTSVRDALSGKYRETVTTIKDGALITSGGGFSVLFPRPAYQDKAVGPYVKYTSETGLANFFNANGRAYPDITGLGHAFPVFVKGEMLPTDGTSVSAPLLASMVVLINKMRLEAGHPVLGFMNPLLYQFYDVCPHVFTDITEGDISCGSPDMGCCSKGHVATSGWDATSGVGTLKFTRFVNDLQSCIDRIQANAKAHGDIQGYASTSSQISLLTQADSGWTAGQRQVSQLLLSASMVAGVVLISVLISLRSNLVASARRSLQFHRDIREPAREYLLSDDRNHA